MKLKKLFAVMLVVALIAASFAACGGTEAPVEEPEDVVEVNVVEEAAMAYFAEYPENNHMITMEALMPLIDAGEEMFIIDTRAADAYAEGHLAGAVNMPFASTAIADNLEVIPDDVPVYVYCYSGQTASQVTSVLNVAGKPVTNIRGGWNRGISTTAGF
ncbi:MAG: rhodanese-like domain-containing protein, partial [Anaerovoracaceae bacterium]